MRALFTLCLLAVVGTGFAQTNFPLKIRLQASGNVQVPSLHSSALAVWQGKWLFVGGRTNGLHGFQPPVSFTGDGVPTAITVYDPVADVATAMDIAFLPDGLREHLQASSFASCQTNDTLWIAGGYGYMNAQAEYRTFPKAMVVQVGAMVQAVLANDTQALKQSISQFTDQHLAVTGGRLARVQGKFCLVFGHRFDGTYDRSATSGFHLQTYTYAVRRFGIVHQPMGYALSGYTSQTDSLAWRRRDFNLVPEVIGNAPSLVAFSGVFRPIGNLPFYEPVCIGASTAVTDTFKQRFSQYHSATLALSDSAGGRMHTLFFGGLSQYHPDTATGLLVSDTLVPFVHTVSVMTHEANGTWHETLLPVRMPGLQGTAAEFVPNPVLRMRVPGVLSQRDLPVVRTGSSTLLGWIVGGINSPEENPSITDPTLTVADNTLIEVWADSILSTGVGVEALPPFTAQVYPNPSTTGFTVHTTTPNKAPLHIALLDGAKRVLLNTSLPGGTNGGTQLQWPANTPVGQYLMRIRQGNYEETIVVVHAAK